jgi:hypothetical protein
MRRAQAISRKGRGEGLGILRDCTPDALHGVKIQSEPHGDMGRPAEMTARLAASQVFQVTELSEIPCRVSSDPHERRNDLSAVSKRGSAKLWYR